ncbi:MAG: type II CRISPR RNA-guided endonuclease Cas9, partial [Prevotellaceae bacterium]|nr:type II CRISPR RNA-guided endonuclease Cas9 [Prevotellaceae bacterium]
RKAKETEDGTLIDGMEVAKKLYEENITPGQLCLQIIQSGKKNIPDFYRSDLQMEFDRVWTKQKAFYSFLTDELKEELRGKNEKATWIIATPHFVWKETEKTWNNEEGKNEEIVKEHKLVGIKRETKQAEQKLENFQWRAKALSEKMHPEELIIVLQKINGQISNSSGYLGAISDRSKELYFNKQTVGQYLMAQLDENPNASLTNKVFYRQDYLDEFNTLWEKQAETRRGESHSPFTEELKREIRDVIIFYQRRLKSQKGLINFCEFESRQIEVEIDGKKKIKTVGSRVIPRSSPLFQEFKIWQILNNIEVAVTGKKGKRKKQKDNSTTLFDGVEEIDQLELNGRRFLEQEEKELLAKELFVKDKLSKSDALKLLFENPQELDLNFKTIDGNKTGFALFQAYNKIIEISGHEPIDFKKSADNIIKYIAKIFSALNWNTDILQFNSDIELDKQPYYKLWHLLYSFEGDNTPTGNGNLINKIIEIITAPCRCGLDPQSSEKKEILKQVQNDSDLKQYAAILANITFQDDYGSLSAKAIRKILPHLKEGNGYDVACVYAGYEKHSKSSLTKEEIENKILKDHLDILPKNSLRNPVVEKILNQMANVINTIIDTYGKPDEIRVELARELKKKAKEREELTKSVAENTKTHEEIKKILQTEFGLTNVSRNDIIRYKLYKELETRGYKTLYSNTYIPQEKLFSKEFDIEHIIPQSRLFDDSFSNKTLESRSINIEKGNQTAYDFVKEKYGEQGLEDYLNRIETLFKDKKTKLRKLKMSEKDIPDGFIDRDLRNTQYIAKKALEMLNEISRRVVATTGSITDQLREDWQLINVMQELNWEKYKNLGLTYYIEDRDGRQIPKIKEWTKRNDHRHHAMDALTIAFTKDAFIQYFNNKNASFIPNSNEYALKTKYFENARAIPPMPLNEFRAEAKKHLENTLISIKAKNKVVTTNINTIKKNGGTNKKAQQTPRGQLHLETVFGSHKEYVKKITRGKTSVTLETVYTIRKPISPDLKIDKVVDAGICEILKKRLEEYGNDPKKAFANLDENPIWLNKEKGISIKRVTISGINNAESLHEKKDKDGNLILDSEGKKIPVDFVNTGNNHHVAVYRKPVLDKKGQVVHEENGDIKYELEENVISFYDAVKLKNLGLPIIIKDTKDIWDKVISRGIDDQSFLRKLPKEGLEFLFSMKQNEYFVFPKTEKREKVNEETGEITEDEVVTFNPKDYGEDWFKNLENYALISPNLFRVQTMSKVMYGNNTIRDYKFRHHLETSVKDESKLKNVTYKQYKTLSFCNFVIKIRLNHIGQIVSVGEY